MNDLKKMLVALSLFGVVMLFIGYHLHEAEQQCNMLEAFSAVEDLEPEKHIVIMRSSQVKAPRHMAKSSSKVMMHQSAPDLMTKLNSPKPSLQGIYPNLPLQGIRPGLLPLPPSVIGTRKIKESAPLKDQVEDDGLSHNYSLPQDVIDGVKTFTFFIGYSRSGSSIVSSLMDAHPHMVVAYEYQVIRQWNSKLNNMAYLYNELYERSQKDAKTGWRSKEKTTKNYTLHIDSGWQGSYDKYISVIGDKNAGNTVVSFIESPTNFIKTYTQLQKTVKVPIKAVFVVRNPYDIISTRVLYRNSEALREILNNTALFDETIPRSDLPATDFKVYMRKLKKSSDEQAYEDAKFKTVDLESSIRYAAQRASTISQIIEIIGIKNVWQVHNMDLVNNPKSTMMEMCDFFNIYCSADYLQMCADSVFKSVSKTRDLVFWPQMEKQLVIDNVTKAYPFFNRYTFESD